VIILFLAWKIFLIKIFYVILFCILKCFSEILIHNSIKKYKLNGNSNAIRKRMKKSLDYSFIAGME
jgi:cell division protein FtsL